MEKLRKLATLTPVRYLFVGGTSFVIEMSCLLGMYHVLHFSLPLATSIAYWIGFALAFGLQKLVAFQDKRRQTRVLAWQAVLFTLLTFWNWGFTVFLVGLFPAAFMLASRPAAQVIFASWNYFLYKHFIFNKGKRPAWTMGLWSRLNAGNLVWWAVGLTTGWRVVLEAVNQIVYQFTHNPLPHTGAVGAWARWDGGWYLNVNNVGYAHTPGPAVQENVAFFPGFPEIVGGLARILHIDYLYVGLVCNFVVTLLLVYLLMRLARLFAERLGAAKQWRKIAITSAVALLAYPASFFFAAYYAEALLVLGVVGAIYFALVGRLWVAVPFMILASASKVMGVVATVTVGIIVLEQWIKTRGTPMQLIKQWAITALGALGLAAYMAYLWIRFGDPLLFYHIQQAWGRNESGFFALRIVKNYYLHLFDPAHFGGIYGYALNVLMMAMPFALLALGWIAWRRYRLFWPGALAIIVTIIPLSTGIMDSIQRYSLVAAALIPFATLAVRNARPFIIYGILGISALAMLGFAAGFLEGTRFTG